METLGLVFGSGEYCAIKLNWGSESLPIQLLTYFGLAGSFLSLGIYWPITEIDEVF